jgi:hypothetical protein
LSGLKQACLLQEGFRRDFWRARGASEAEAVELVAYGESPVQRGPLPARGYPLADAPSAVAWDGYVEEAREAGVAAVLRRVLVQLAFPIEAGIGQTEPYLAATRRGLLPEGREGGVAFAQPKGLHIFLHPTPAGRVPVILASVREDFESLVRALTQRNEPAPVPAAQGACMVAGYNNWDRVAQLRRAWEAAHPDDVAGIGWAAAFRELVPQKQRYQDRFLILSSGFYSAVAPARVGLSERAWALRSIELRLEHECTHFFMRQVFGAMRESLLDELVADYMGIVSVFGEFRSDAFLLFMGLEGYPQYRGGGRLENYRGKPPLSEASFALLPHAVVRAAENLGRHDPSRRLGELGPAAKATLITALTRTGLEGLACDEAGEWLGLALAEAGAPGPRRPTLVQRGEERQGAV